MKILWQLTSAIAKAGGLLKYEERALQKPRYVVIPNLIRNPGTLHLMYKRKY
ncbi:MAG: hypothetical protein GVX78_05470 [Bacteroidetes bacterium]|jgi:hypothetical protein|nr:hypothetical protein [Bacteroidota bacterium]